MRINSYRPQTYLGGGEQKIQQHSNTLTQHKMTHAAKCAVTLSEPIEKKASRSIEQILLVWKLRQRPCQQYGYQKGVRQLFPK